MRKLLLLLTIAALFSSPTMAGKNASGAMVVHTDDNVHYTFFGGIDWCMEYEDVDPGDCAALNSQSNYFDPNWLFGSMIWVLAAFPESSSPGVTVIYFGIEHNFDLGFIGGWGFCGPANSLEVPDAGWPYDWQNAGNSLAFGSPIAGDTLFPFYWFGAYGWDPNYIGTGINPAGGYAGFVSDDNPGVLDECFLFGQVRWFVPGFNQCPPPEVPPEACCFADGSCEMLVPEECESLGGVPYGFGTVCDPNPCAPPFWACCFADGSCMMMQEWECLDAGGSWLFDVLCDPNPCGPPRAVCCLLEIGGECILTTEADCFDQCGLWIPDLDNCDPNPCPPIWPPSGACCRTDGTCYIEFECTCERINQYDYVGDDVPCDPNPCPTAVDETTWGSIKAAYR